MNHCTIELLHDDPWVVVAWKPHGLSTICPPDGQSLQTVLASQLSVPPQTLWVVHRLDRLTAGIVILARTKTAASLLSLQFAAGRIEKRYSATVHLPAALADPISQRWEDFLIKVPDQARVEAGKSGQKSAKHCITDVSVVRVDRETATADLHLRPKTGRMHQLRFQTAIRQMPIVGDPIYGESSLPASNDQASTDRPATVQPATIQPATVQPATVQPSMKLVADKIAFYHPKTAAQIQLHRPSTIAVSGELPPAAGNG